MRGVGRKGKRSEGSEQEGKASKSSVQKGEGRNDC